jgi:hypothetical protein
VTFGSIPAFEQGKGNIVVSLRIYRLIGFTLVELFGIRETRHMKTGRPARLRQQMLAVNFL